MSNINEKIKAKAEIVGGAVEKAAGKIVGSEKMEEEGATTEAKGRIRDKVANIAKGVKDAAAAIVKPLK
jgi:uncharacterized protein YjbJ (UPF0337 family)